MGRCKSEGPLSRCAKAFAADPADYVPPTFPRPTPAFPLRDLAGSPIMPESLKGKVEGRIVAQWNGGAAKERELEARLEGLLAADPRGGRP